MNTQQRETFDPTHTDPTELFKGINKISDHPYGRLPEDISIMDFRPKRDSSPKDEDNQQGPLPAA